MYYEAAALHGYGARIGEGSDVSADRSDGPQPPDHAKAQHFLTCAAEVGIAIKLRCCESGGRLGVQKLPINLG
eukprot:766555-Hanusia_phi.AAC.2